MEGLCSMFSLFRTFFLINLSFSILDPLLEAKPAAFKVFGKITSFEEVEKQEQSKFYEIENEKYKIIEGKAKEEFIRIFWQKLAKSAKSSIVEAKARYFKEHASYSEAKFKETLSKYGNHPNLKDLSQQDLEAQIRKFLSVNAQKEAIETIVNNAIEKGELAVLFPKPKEPTYQVHISEDDQVRYGPKLSDSKPLQGGCKGDECSITIVEYSEFQCPFCARVVATTDRLLERYAGRIRLISRQFPLHFHPRARPAAIAATCAGFQGKYWDMRKLLFANQQKLEDKDIEGYAKELARRFNSGPNKFDKVQYDQCIRNPAESEAVIDRHLKLAEELDVQATPTYIINNKKFSGAQPYEEFVKFIDYNQLKTKA